MAITLEIPLMPDVSDQTVDVTLEDVPYQFRVLWNERFGYFSLSVKEIGGDDLLTNVKMVNDFPLVGRFRKLALKGDLLFVHRAGKSYRPTYSDLGRDYGLFYYDSESPPDYPLPLAPRG